MFHRNDYRKGIYNRPDYGPEFGDGPFDLVISADCHEGESSRSFIDSSYGRSGPGLNRFALFGQEFFRVVDYEVFKIVIH
jgi:hypothetical protein